MIKVTMTFLIQKTIDVPEPLDPQTIVDLSVYQLESKPLFELGLIKSLHDLAAACTDGTTNEIVNTADAVVRAFRDRRPEKGWDVSIKSVEEIADEQEQD